MQKDSTRAFVGILAGVALLVADRQARRAALAQGEPGQPLPERQIGRLALEVKLAQAVEQGPYASVFVGQQATRQRSGAQGSRISVIGQDLLDGGQPLLGRRDTFLMASLMAIRQIRHRSLSALSKT